MNLEPGTAAAVIGLAGFQLWDAWQKNAPTISDCRNSVPGDIGTKQKLLDAEMTVGTLTVVIGGAFAVLTKDMTAMLIMLSIFAALIFMHHWILAAPPVKD